MASRIKRTEIKRTEIKTNDISAYELEDSSKSSMKKYIEQFSMYDVVDTVYDIVYQIPDIVDEIAVNLNILDSGCDKYDYAMAAFSGVLTGLFDAFFVGKPGDTVLGEWTDSKVDNAVLRFSQMIFGIDKTNHNNSSKKKPNDIASAIGYLERRFKVNYDARFASDLIGGEVLTDFTPSSHHLKSLAHCPDIVGLFFSILDQFTNKTTIINDGKIIRLESVNGNIVVYGNNIVAKLICGIINWIGHLISDMSGSSGTRGHKESRGMGIPIPGFELFQFSNCSRNEEVKALAKLTEKMYLNGYDMRFGIAMSIPVIGNDIMVKVFWALRERYQYKENWKSIIKKAKNDKRLLRMAFVSAGCFSLVDIGEAYIRSEGNLLLFALRINYVGICKFAFAGYREVIVRVKEVTDECLDEILDSEWEAIFSK